MARRGSQRAGRARHQQSDHECIVGALTFGDDHLNDLAPARDQIGETSCHLIRQWPSFS